jgi:putative toxin-antitoxin system antitoxin component (TIGR02293 family)
MAMPFRKSSSGKLTRRAQTAKRYVGMSPAGTISVVVESDAPGGETVQLINAVNAGFPYEFLDKLSESTGLAVETIADTVRIPPRTLSRRKVERRLQPDESERLLRVSNLIAKAVDLFDGDRDAATNWLQRPQRGLGDGVPLEFAKTEIGARAVEDLIGRLEHGVFP